MKKIVLTIDAKSGKVTFSEGANTFYRVDHLTPELIEDGVPDDIVLRALLALTHDNAHVIRVPVSKIQEAFAIFGATLTEEPCPASSSEKASTASTPLAEPSVPLAEPSVAGAQ